MKIIALILLSALFILSALGAGKMLCFALFLPHDQGLPWLFPSLLSAFVAFVMGCLFCQVVNAER